MNTQTETVPALAGPRAELEERFGTLVDTAECAIMVGRSKRTVENWRNTHKCGPAYIRYRNEILYPVQSIAEFLKNEVDTTRLEEATRA